MKSSSKAKRLRKQRGRPFVEGVVREPNGRISRAITPPEPADKLTLEVRARMMGISVEAARDERLASYIGRLAIIGVEETRGGESRRLEQGSEKQAGGISAAQYGAACKFLEVYNDWRKAVSSPLAIWEEQRVEGVFVGLNGEEIARLAKMRYEGALKAVQEAQSQHGQDNLYAALQYLVIEDRPLPHMVGSLRLVLNALVRHFGMMDA